MSREFAKQLCVFTFMAIVGSLVAPRAYGQPSGPRFHTRSIVACDPQTRECGVAVVSFPTGVPAVIPVGEPGAIVANQGTPSFRVARAIIDNLKQTPDARSALDLALGLDTKSLAPLRQFGVAALAPQRPGVTVATFSGAGLPRETCEVVGATYAVQANSQTTSEVCAAMASGFEGTTGSLSRRLLSALKAGSLAGADSRGEFSAAVRVYADSNLLFDLTNISADANVDRSANWQADLEFGLNAYVCQAPGDSRDLTPLTDDLTKQVLQALKSLRYYQGSPSLWTDEAEAALLAFQNSNEILFPKPTIVVGKTRFINAPLADYIVEGARRQVLIPSR